MFFRKTIFRNAFVLFLLGLVSCELNDVEKPGNLVPPTADEDPALPQLAITVAGHSRAVHLQTFGNPQNPAVFVLHGGPGADFRIFLPFKQLADRYYLVMWDSRGAGLSERVTKEELSIDSFDEEVLKIKQALVSDRKVTLLGHSFGGNVVARYAARHPKDVERLILITPGKLDESSDARSNGGDVGFLDGQDFFWQNEILTSRDHAAADYKAVELLPKSSRNWTCDKSIIENYPFWRFGAYHYNMVLQNTVRLPKDFNWVAGLENFTGSVTLITGTCGALSQEFQNINRVALPRAEYKVISGAGHISLFTDFADSTVAAVRSALN